jgi:hypothetical protein
MKVSKKQNRRFTMTDSINTNTTVSASTIRIIRSLLSRNTDGTTSDMLHNLESSYRTDDNWEKLGVECAEELTDVDLNDTIYSARDCQQAICEIYEELASLNAPAI